MKEIYSITDSPGYITRYKHTYCPECRSLTFSYQDTGLVCFCKNPWEFKTEYWERYAGVDSTRLLWKEVWVEIYDI